MYRLPLTAMLLGTASLLSACATIPTDGPSSSEVISIEQSAEVSGLDIKVVKIDADNIKALGAAPIGRIFPNVPLTGGTASQIHPGDVLTIRIWEANPDGLFSSTDTPAAPINLTVSESGQIFLPYAGEVIVSGLTPSEIRTKLTDSLRGKVIDPQVQVEVQSSAVNSVSLVGGVTRAGQYPIGGAELTLLDAISASGGSLTPKYETSVSILRDGKTKEVMLSDVFEEPLNNLRLRPGDVIELSHLPRSFTAFGSVARSGQIIFPGEDLSLEQALAQAGGLDARLSDAGGIFVFRYEDKKRLTSAGIEVGESQELIPAIFRLDMSSPEAFFLARSFEIRDDDILYVATAPAAEFGRFISTIVSPALSQARAIQTLTE